MTKLKLFTLLAIVTFAGISTLYAVPDTVMYYSYNNYDADSVYDESGNEINAEIVNAEFKDGFYGKALECDDSTHYLLVKDDDMLDVQHFTLKSWVKPYTYGSDWRRMEILEKYNAYWMNIGSGNDDRQGEGILRCGVFAKMNADDERGTWYYIDSDRPIALQEWTHTAFTFDGDSLKSFINGEKVAAMAIQEPYIHHPEDGRLSIGIKYDHIGELTEQAFFDGLIDDTYILNSALSVEEIRSYFDFLQPGEKSILSPFSASTSDSLQVNSNIAWLASTNADWIQIETAADSGDAYLNYTLTENDLQENRVGTITLTDKRDMISREVTVEQFSSDLLYTLSDTAHIFFNRLNMPYKLQLATGTDWECEFNADWITLSDSSGEGGVYPIAITVEDYSSNVKARYDTLRFFIEEELVDSVIICQLHNIEFDVNMQQFQIPGPFPGTVELSFTANCDWMFESNERLTFSPEKGFGDATIDVISLDTNKTSGFEQVALSLWLGEGDYMVEDFGTFPKMNHVSVFEDDTITANALGGNYGLIHYTNYDWSITGENEWCTAEDNTGIVSQAILPPYDITINNQLNILENTETVKRYVTLKLISARKVDSVVVEQAAATPDNIQILTENNARLYPNPARNWLTVEISEKANNVTCKIYNVTGELKKVEELNELQNKIAIDDLNVGVYIMQLVDNNGKLLYREKFSVQ